MSISPRTRKIFKRLRMTSEGAGLFRVDEKLRTKKEAKRLSSHPWSPRLQRFLQEAGEYGATWVYFRLHTQTGGPRPEIFIYEQAEQLHEGAQGIELAMLQKKLWNYGSVPLALFIRSSAVDIFNLLTPPQFKDGEITPPTPVESLQLSALETVAIAGAVVKGITKQHSESWERFNSEYFDNGGFWEMEANRELGVGNVRALESMVQDMRSVRNYLKQNLEILSDEGERDRLIRRLLIVILMIQFLKERGILPPDYFQGKGFENTNDFLQVLSDPVLLIKALDVLKEDFNGDVFHIDDPIRETIKKLKPEDLIPFVNFADPKSDGIQLHFWDRYSFRDLPVEVISYVYEEFLGGESQSFFTPHHLVDLMLDECMPPSQIQLAFSPDRNGRKSRQFRILDPSCGSGVFLVGAWKRLLEAYFTTGGSGTPSDLKQLLVRNLHGVDIRPESVELSIFSLSVALCSAFKPKPNNPRFLYEKLRELKFPNLHNANLHEGDFFKARNKLLDLGQRFEVVVGNPPFESELPEQAQQDLDKSNEDEDGKKWPSVPDHQIAYLFLRGVMPLVAEGGCSCLVQPASLIYNEKTIGFRRALFNNWEVPEILDFASLSKLFTSRKGSGSSVSVKTIAVLMRKNDPCFEKPLLHATFRRVALLDSRKYFEIDPQDLHWTPWQEVINEPRVWKANLLGGGRLLNAYRQLVSHGTLEKRIERYELEKDWICREGFTEGKNPKVEHEEAVGISYLETEGLSSTGIDEAHIIPNQVRKFHRKLNWAVFTPPHILIKEHSSLPIALRKKGEPLLFRDKIVGVSAPSSDIKELEQVYDFLSRNSKYVEFFAAFGPQFLIGKQTALLKKSLMDLPYPENGKLEFRGIQKHLRDDVIDYMIPLIKDNDGTRDQLNRSAVTKEINTYVRIFLNLMQTMYSDLDRMQTIDLGSAWCVSFQRGDSEKTLEAYDDIELLREHLDALLLHEKGKALRCWRIVRHFSEDQVYIIKPKSIRYWLKSAAVRDADEMFSWAMHESGAPNVSLVNK